MTAADGRDGSDRDCMYRGESLGTTYQAVLNHHRFGVRNIVAYHGSHSCVQHAIEHIRELLRNMTAAGLSQ